MPMIACTLGASSLVLARVSSSRAAAVAMQADPATTARTTAWVGEAASAARATGRQVVQGLAVRAHRTTGLRGADARLLEAAL